MKKSVMQKLFVMFLALGIVSAANASVIWHYTFDETTGTTVNDSVGSYNGTLVNATGTPAYSFDNQSVSGKYCNALYFRGPNASNGGVGDDYINVTTGDSLLPGAGDNFSVSMWVQTTNWGQGAVLFSYNRDNLLFTIGLNTVSGVAQLQVYSRNASADTTIQEQTVITGINSSVWHLITVSVTDTDPTIYLDGVDVGASTLTTSWTAGTGINIGRRNASSKRYFTGAMDDFAIFDTALTAEQVAAIYNSTTAIPEPATIAMLALGLAAICRRTKK
jgi:hypothetical protein